MGSARVMIEGPQDSENGIIVSPQLCSLALTATASPDTILIVFFFLMLSHDGASSGQSEHFALFTVAMECLAILNTALPLYQIITREPVSRWELCRIQVIREQWQSGCVD